MKLFIGWTLIISILIQFANLERIRLEAKRLIRGKVFGNGLSISAKSLSHCIDYCNRRRKTCDGVVFHEIIEKCRLINKCVPVYQVDNTSSIVYFSRRPLITAPGYFYDAKSDSCIGLVKAKGNYAEAEDHCRKQKADLALVDGKKLNQFAGDLLLRSGIDWAWISEGNVAHESAVKAHGISGNDVLSQKVFSPEVVHWRNNSKRNCWGLNDRGQWGQFSCKNQTMMALCQVRQFAA